MHVTQNGKLAPFAFWHKYLIINTYIIVEQREREREKGTHVFMLIHVYMRTPSGAATCLGDLIEHVQFILILRAYCECGWPDQSVC